MHRGNSCAPWLSWGRISRSFHMEPPQKKQSIAILQISNHSCSDFLEGADDIFHQENNNLSLSILQYENLTKTILEDFFQIFLLRNIQQLDVATAVRVAAVHCTVWCRCAKEERRKGAAVSAAVKCFKERPSLPFILDQCVSLKSFWEFSLWPVCLLIRA